MRLKWKSDENADPELARYYQSVEQVSDQTATPEAVNRRRSGGSIFHTFSLRPDVGYHFMEAVRLGNFAEKGFLSQAVRQMIATYTSALRSCVF